MTIQVTTRYNIFQTKAQRSRNFFEGLLFASFPWVTRKVPKSLREQKRSQESSSEPNVQTLTCRFLNLISTFSVILFPDTNSLSFRVLFLFFFLVRSLCLIRYSSSSDWVEAKPFSECWLSESIFF